MQISDVYQMCLLFGLYDMYVSIRKKNSSNMLLLIQLQ